MHMPYKNPEDKKSWEREHRAQRNAQRKARQSSENGYPIHRNTTPDPDRASEPENAWATIIGFAVWFGAMLLIAFVEASLPLRMSQVNRMGRTIPEPDSPAVMVPASLCRERSGRLTQAQRNI